MTCPKCGSTEVRIIDNQYTYNEKGKEVLINIYECKTCGETFEGASRHETESEEE